MFSNKLNYKVINFTALMLLFYIGFSNIGIWYNAIIKFLSLLLPFIIAFCFAYSLNPLLHTLMDKGISKKMAVLIITVAVLLILIALLVITIPLLYDQLGLFYKYIIKVLDTTSSKYNLNLGKVEIELSVYINLLLKKLSKFLSNGVIIFFNRSISFSAKFIIGFITGIYFLSGMDKIKEKIGLFSKNISKKFYKYLKCVDIEINNYVKGLITFMIIQFFEYSILFLVIGHPNWLLLGILASITTVIPYFGGIATNILGVVIATSISYKLLTLTIIVCIVAPTIDSYFISPKIYGKTNNVSPLTTIILVWLGGVVGGALGIMIALPLYLLARTTYLFFKNDIKKEVKNVTKINT